MISKKFKLFHCCIPVKGVTIGTIIDLQRDLHFSVPNNILEYIEEYSNKSLYYLFFDFKESKKILKKFIRFFIQNELVIVADQLDCFTRLSTNYIRPFQIDTITIEIVDFENFHHNLFSLKIEELGVKALKIIIKDDVLITIKKILDLLKNSKTLSISLFTPHNVEIERDLEFLCNKYFRLTQIIFFNYSPNNKEIKRKNTIFNYDFLPVEKVFYKGVQNPNNFVININSFLEAVNFNLNYNRTIYIDSNGNLKRHMLDVVDFGIITSVDISIQIENNVISELWHITKDKINICKDCQFRYICPDDRVPIKLNPADLFYSHLTNCKYDPYTDKWN